MMRLAIAPLLLIAAATAAAQPPQPFRVGPPTLDGAEFTPDSKAVLVRFLTISTNGNTRHASLYDVSTGKRLAGPDAAAPGRDWTAEAIHPNGALLLVSRPAEGDARELVLWDWKTRRQVRAFDPPVTLLDRAAFTPDGKMVLTTHRDNRVLTWDPEKGEQKGALGLKRESPPPSLCGPALVIGTDSTRAVVADREGLAAWDLASGKKVESWAGITDKLVRGELAACSADGRLAVTAYMTSSPDDAGPFVWDLKAGRLVRRLALPDAYVGAAAVTEKGRVLAASGLGAVRAWDADGRRLWHSAAGKWKAVSRVVLSPDGKYLLSCGEKKTLQMWDTEKRKVVWTADERR